MRCQASESKPQFTELFWRKISVTKMLKIFLIISLCYLEIILTSVIILLDGNEIQDVKNSVSGSYKIKKCISLHMIPYFLDGSIQTKQHLCSCVECVVRNFIDCNLNPGVKLIVENTEGSDTDTSDTDTDESDTDDDEEIQIEQELRTECVADIVTPNSFTAVFHHQNLLNCFIFARLSLLIQHQIWW